MQMTSDLCLESDEVCRYFHHVTPCPECPGISKTSSCLSKKPCIRKSVCCIAVLRGRDDIAWQGMFFNKVAPNEPKRVHAEAQLVRCSALLDALASAPALQELRLWLTFQPCHYSGGDDKTQSTLSCTELLRQLHEQHLQRSGVRLRIKIANVYRAHWSRLREATTHMRCILSSRSGIALLKTFADVDAFAPEDWVFVESLCKGGVTVPTEHCVARRIMDAHNRAFLRSGKWQCPTRRSPFSVV